MPRLWSKTPDMSPNAVVGAARQIHLDRRAEVERTRERGTAEWQHTAWRHYDSIGEVKYAMNYFASVASRVRLFAGYMDEDSDTPAPMGNASRLERSFVTAARYELDKLNKGIGGQPNLIRQFALNLNVAGEVYLVGSHDSWTARSTTELRFDANGQPQLHTSRSAPLRHVETLDKDRTFVARIWRTHPQYSDEADSSMRGVEDDCAQLLLLSRLIRASAQSRLNAGIMFVADELRFQRLHDDGESDGPDVDPFEEELYLTATDPVGQTDSPSEVMPMIVRAPAALGENGLKHVTFGRDFDENVIAQHGKALERILNGLDIPKDIVTGLANVRYSNARQITEDMYKAHVEPMMVLICEALTNVFLRPHMRSRGYSEEQIKRLHVWYDPSEVVVKPDRSEDADKGYERMLISAPAWRRAHGFSDVDAPTDEEIVRRIALGGTVAPATTLEFLRAVAPDFVKHAEQLANDAFGSPVGDPTSTPPPPSGPNDPGGVAQSTGDSKTTNGSGSGGGGTTPSGSGVGVQKSNGTGNRSEPPEGERPPQPDAASIMEVLRGLKLPENSGELRSGNGQPKSAELADRERRLSRALDVERRSRESMHSYLTDVVAQALHRAGARTVSKVRGNPEIKSLISAVPMAATFSNLPDGVSQDFGLDPEELVRDTIADAKDGYVRRMSNNMAQGWRSLGDHVYSELWDDHVEDIELSWEWLYPQLVSRAADKLQLPSSEMQYVPMQYVREASARAGGRGDSETVVPASGRAVLSGKALDATGWEFSGAYTWVYGVSDSGFGPHEKLDGKVFHSWFGDELATPQGETEFPFTSHWYPGDHDGCRCDAVPIPLDPVANPSRSAPVQHDRPLAASGVNGHSVR